MLYYQSRADQNQEKKMSKPMLSIVGLAAAALIGCATDSAADREKIEADASVQRTIQVGDTSSLWVVSRTTVQPNGRTVSDKNYTSFRLNSSDPAVALVIRGQFLVGMKAGESQVTVEDENSNLESDPVTITVVP